MRFRIHAADPRGQVTSLTLEAPSEAAVREIVRGKGLEAFHVASHGLKLRWKAKGAFPTALFSAELMALLDAGLNLVEALQALAEKDTDGIRHEVLASILGAIRRGEPLSQAVAALPQHFPPLYVATIKASERTGNVREALSRYIAYQEELDRVRKKVVSASIYPAILALVGSLVLAFLLFYVVPRFAHVYEDMAGGLPLFSRLLLSFGSFVGDNAWLIGFALLAALATTVWAFSRPAFRAWVNTRLWRLPALGERMKTYQLSRLYRTAGMLLRAGVPAVRAVEMVKDLLAAHLRPQLLLVRAQIEQGKPMSAAFAAADLATPVASRMMQAGERGGDMGRMLGEIARFHDEEVARFVEWFTRAFEPALMAVLGLAVGGVVVLMYMPVFELAGEHPMIAKEIAELAAQLRIQPIDLPELHLSAPAFDVIAYGEALRRGCVAVRDANGQLAIVLGDAYDLDTQDWIEDRLRADFRYRLAQTDDVVAYLAKQEQALRALDGFSENIAAENKDDSTTEISFESAAEGDGTVVRLVSSTLYDALKAGASDVHLESGRSGLTIKYRIDGVLTAAESLPGTELAEQVISRIKVMSELDIAERRVPQDGRFKAKKEGREIDFRVSVMPSVFGEDAVLRILDRRALTDQVTGLTLDSLGYESELKEKLRALSRQPYGMILATGPTGSGKTTTLYALISETNKGQDKFVTIEDPVEYQLPGVLQIPVNEQKGLTFARGLRSILRHDPDRIMVGEIRDPETAEIAVQSALTGHLVYTTVHANNAIDVLGRFQHMGVDGYNLVSALNGVLAQRLVRTFCSSCKGKGCAECRGTGFKGRKAIGELLVLNDELRELIVARAPARKLKEAARAAGTIPLREAAMRLVEAGETTLEEINRVTFVA